MIPVVLPPRSSGRLRLRFQVLLVVILLIAASIATVPTAFADGPGQPIFLRTPGVIEGQMTGTSGVPIYVEWLPPSSVGSGIASYQFERSTRRCVRYVPLATFPVGTSNATFVLPASSNGIDCLRMRVIDTSGQAGAWTDTVVGQLRNYQERRTGIRKNGTRILYTGAWHQQRLAGASRGAVRWSDDTTASATLEFYGTSIAMVTDKMPGHGKFYLTFDNNPVDANPGSVPIDPFNTDSATTQLRSIIWSRNYFADGLHFLTIQPAGPLPARIDIDSFIVIRPSGVGALRLGSD